MLEEKFFNTNRTSDPAEKSVIEFLKRRNEKLHFVEKTVKQLQYLYNANYALNKSKELYPNSVHNGNGDAFRHALFSALNSKVLGVNLTKQLGDAHELFPNNPPLENQMDLFNNQIGRDQFTYLQTQGQSGHFFKEALVISLVQKVQNGQLKNLAL